MMRTIKSQVGTVILSLEAQPTLRRADPYLQLPEPERNGWPGDRMAPLPGVLVLAATEQGEGSMSLGNEVDAVFRREVKSLPAFEKAQAATGSGIAPPVDEMNQLLMGLVVAAQRSFHLLADRIEQIENA